MLERVEEKRGKKGGGGWGKVVLVAICCYLKLPLTPIAGKKDPPQTTNMQALSEKHPKLTCLLNNVPFTAFSFFIPLLI